MKKIKLLSAIIIIFSAVLVSNDSSAIKIRFGTKSRPDSEGNCVGDRGICLIVEIKLGPALARNAGVFDDLGDDMAYGDLEIVGSSQLRLDIIEQNSDAELGPYFVLGDDIILGDEICKELNVDRVQLSKGSYKVDYSEFRYGSVFIDAKIEN